MNPWRAGAGAGVSTDGGTIPEEPAGGMVVPVALAWEGRYPPVALGVCWGLEVVTDGMADGSWLPKTWRSGTTA